MKTISYEDRQKIQTHLAEVWKILYANDLESLEFQRTPKSKQKRRMCEFLITFNKNHNTPSSGFKLCVSDRVGCWQGIKFEETPEEIAKREEKYKRVKAGYEARLKILNRKEARRKELEEEHHVAYWYKHHMTPHWVSGNSSIWYFEQDENNSRTYISPLPNNFVYWLYHGVDADGKPFSKDARIKYMKKYKLDKLYDLDTGARLEDDKKEKVFDIDAPKDIPVEMKKEDNAKLAKDYLRKKFEDGSWKDEAIKLDISKHEKVIDTYLDTVREFIKQQEELDLHGLALYGINEERTKAHEALLEDYNLHGHDENSEIARDVTKSFDFTGEYKTVNGTMKTVFYSEYDASLRLAYALDVVISKKYI